MFSLTNISMPLHEQRFPRATKTTRYISSKGLCCDFRIEVISFSVLKEIFELYFEFSQVIKFIRLWIPLTVSVFARFP